METNQVSLGSIFLANAGACYNLTAAVPAEYEASLWDEGDNNMRSAALFGEPSAEKWVTEEAARKADRSNDQKCFYEISPGF